MQTYADDSELAPLLTASVLVREKKYTDAIAYLEDHSELELLKAQVYIAQGKLTSPLKFLDIVLNAIPWLSCLLYCRSISLLKKSTRLRNLSMNI